MCERMESLVEAILSNSLLRGGTGDDTVVVIRIRLHLLEALLPARRAAEPVRIVLLTPVVRL